MQFPMIFANFEACNDFFIFFLVRNVTPIYAYLISHGFNELFHKPLSTHRSVNDYTCTAPIS